MRDGYSALAIKEANEQACKKVLKKKNQVLKNWLLTPVQFLVTIRDYIVEIRYHSTSK